MDEISDRVDKLSDRVDKLSDRVDKLSDRVDKMSNDMDVMKLAGKEYGHVNSVCITDKGIIVTCENGMIFLNVPNTIIERLKEIDIKPVVVRFTDSSTYIAIDADGRVACFM